MHENLHAVCSPTPIPLSELTSILR